jgi:hypothetical protein
VGKVQIPTPTIHAFDTFVHAGRIFSSGTFIFLFCLFCIKKNRQSP